MVKFNKTPPQAFQSCCHPMHSPSEKSTVVLFLGSRPPAATAQVACSAVWKWPRACPALSVRCFLPLAPASNQDEPTTITPFPFRTGRVFPTVCFWWPQSEDGVDIPFASMVRDWKRKRSDVIAEVQVKLASSSHRCLLLELALLPLNIWPISKYQLDIPVPL